MKKPTATEIRQRHDALAQLLEACRLMLDALEGVEERAKFAARLNPIGFYIWTGKTLPDYLIAMAHERRQCLELIQRCEAALSGDLLAEGCPCKREGVGCINYSVYPSPPYFICAFTQETAFIPEIGEVGVWW